MALLSLQTGFFGFGSKKNTGVPACRYAYYQLGLMLLFLLFWCLRVTDQITFRAAFTCLGYLLICFSYGRSLSVVLSFPGVSRIKFIFQFLIGYFLFNTLLFFMTLLSPLGIYGNALLLVLVALGLELVLKNRHAKTVEDQDWLVSLLCILVSGIGASIWCLDQQSSIFLDEQNILFRTWTDTFYHVRNISSFENAHGIKTINSIFLSDSTPKIYHYAMYVSASVIAAFADAPAVQVYSFFLLPFGILLTGLAAFMLVSSILGVWPALAATVAIVLIPDAYQQGFDNRYLSYYVQSQVNLGMLYGLACISLAWAFMFDGCRRGQYKSIILAYAIVLFSVIYKSHLFVANSFLILIYPCIFFSVIKVRWRILLGVLFTLVFTAVISYSQNFESIPVMRLDGSGIKTYGGILLRAYEPGGLKDFFSFVFYESNYSKPVLAFFTVWMLLLSSFGLWLAVLLFVAYLAKAKLGAYWFYFPLMVLANYLIMSIGLAVDTHHVGALEELLNRPFSWAYFVLAIWSSSVGYYLLFGNSWPDSKLARSSLLLIIGLLGIFAWQHARNIQAFPAWPGFTKYEEFNKFPLCFVKSAEYIRANSKTNEVIQDSENDPLLMLSAVAERQDYVSGSLNHSSRQDLLSRMTDLKDLKQSQNIEQIKGFVGARNISWYLLQPKSVTAWPEEVLGQAVFECNGYRVFHFGK